MKFLIALAAVSVAVTGASAAQAKDGSGPVACIYNGVAHDKQVKPEVLQELVAKGLQPKTTDEEFVQRKLGDRLNSCRAKYGWSKPRQNAAFKYLQARVMFDAQKPVLKNYDIGFTKLDKYASSLDENARNAWMSGKVSAEMSSALYAGLKAEGAKVEGLTQDDYTKLSQVLGQALVGVIVEQDAQKEYDAR